MEQQSQQKNPRRRIIRIVFMAAAVAAVAVVITVGILTFVFSDMLLNRYAKGKIESVFAEAYPGSVLHIGRMHYNVLKNFTECLAVELSASDSSVVCTAASFSVSSIGWKQFITLQEITPAVIKRSMLTAQDIVVKLPGRGYDIRCANISISMPDSALTANTLVVDFEVSRYHFRCGRLYISASDSELVAEDVDLRPIDGDEDFFSASPFRRTRVSMKVAQWYISHVPVQNLLMGKTYTARTMDVFDAHVDLLVNRDKPSDPHSAPPLMPAEALAGLKRTVRLDTLRLHNANVLYGERVEAHGPPGLLTFDSVQVSAQGIGVSAGDTIAVRASARLMNSCVMNVAMRIPMKRNAFALSYHGTVTGMDCRVLNRFLETAEHTRITSCMLHDASFDVNVAHGRATGHLKANYTHLYLTLLDKKTGSAIAFGKQIATLFANLLKIRGNNVPDESGEMTIGNVHYAQKKTDTFMNVAWFSLRSALGDVVGF